jgi:hypothetical protein
VLLLYTSIDEEKMCNLDKSKEGTTGVIKLKWNQTTASYEKVSRLDEAMDWADERYDGFSDTVGDADGAIGAIESPQCDQRELWT